MESIYNKSFTGLNEGVFLISYVFSKKHSEYKKQKKMMLLKQWVLVTNDSYLFDQSEIKIFKNLKLYL